MQTWPGGVPSKPLVGSLKVEPFRTPFQTDMEDGPTRQRRSSTLNRASLSFSIRMTNPEFMTFKLWVRDALIDGTLRFVAPIYVGDGMANRECQFKSPYQDDPGDGTQHTVSIALDVFDY